MKRAVLIIGVVLSVASVLSAADVDPSRVSAEWVGFDRFRDKTSDSCFEYALTLNSGEYFVPTAKPAASAPGSSRHSPPPRRASRRANSSSARLSVHTIATSVSG